MRLEIFDILGRRIRTLASDIYPAGDYRIQWDGRNDNGIRSATGIYLYRIVSESFIFPRKMVLLR